MIKTVTPKTAAAELAAATPPPAETPVVASYENQLINIQDAIAQADLRISGATLDITMHHDGYIGAVARAALVLGAYRVCFVDCTTLEMFDQQVRKLAQKIMLELDVKRDLVDFQIIRLPVRP